MNDLAEFPTNIENHKQIKRCITVIATLKMRIRELDLKLTAMYKIVKNYTNCDKMKSARATMTGYNLRTSEIGRLNKVHEFCTTMNKIGKFTDPLMIVAQGADNDQKISKIFSLFSKGRQRSGMIKPKKSL